MEQFVLIPLSLYNEKIVSNSVTLPKTEKSAVTVDEPIQDSVYAQVNSVLKSGKNNSLVDSILSSPRLRLSSSDTILLDGRDTNVSLVDFIYKIKRKNEDFPDIYFTILDAAKLTPSKVINRNAKEKDRGSWIPFKI